MYGALSPSNLGEVGIVGARGWAPLQRFVSVGALSERPAAERAAAQSRSARKLAYFCKSDEFQVARRLV